jgi:hypothetical protein
MDRAVYAERKAAEVEAYTRAAAALLPLIDALPPQHPDRVPLGEAEAMLREAAVTIAQLGDALVVYSEPDFYAELPPSLASDDQGEHADRALEQVFSE